MRSARSNGKRLNADVCILDAVEDVTSHVRHQFLRVCRDASAGRENGTLGSLFAERA